MKNLDAWPIWVKVIATFAIMSVFWAVMVLPVVWAPLAIIPLAVLVFVSVRSFIANMRR